MTSCSEVGLISVMHVNYRHLPISESTPFVDAVVNEMGEELTKDARIR